jgi:hypothetical protein
MIGQGINTQRIQRWATAVVRGPNAPAGSLRLTLHHASIDDAVRLLRTWELDGIPPREDFDDVIGEIDREAAEDASQLGWGVQRYVLRAATGEGRELGSLTLRYSASAVAPGDAGMFADSEPANARGQVALAMRHTDGAYRLLATGFGNILDSMNRRLGQQDALIEKLMSTYVRQCELTGEMMDKRIEREVWAETKKKEAEIDLHRQIAELDRHEMWTKMGFERLAPLIPVLLTKLGGKGAAPTQATARDEVLAGIIETLTPEQVAGLQGMLTESQMAALMSLVADLQEVRSPGMTPPPAQGMSSPNCKPSDQTGVLAIVRIKKDLLPWAIERLRSAQPLDPPTDMVKIIKIFTLLVKALSRDQYDRLITTDDPLTPAERTAFGRLAEHLNLAPKGAVAAPPMVDSKSPAKTASILGTATLADAVAKGIPIIPKGFAFGPHVPGAPEPKKDK